MTGRSLIRELRRTRTFRDVQRGVVRKHDGQTTRGVMGSPGTQETASHRDNVFSVGGVDVDVFLSMTVVVPKMNFVAGGDAASRRDAG